MEDFEAIENRVVPGIACEQNLDPVLVINRRDAGVVDLFPSHAVTV